MAREGGRDLSLRTLNLCRLSPQPIFSFSRLSSSSPSYPFFMSMLSPHGTFSSLPTLSLSLIQMPSSCSLDRFPSVIFLVTLPAILYLPFSGLAWRICPVRVSYACIKCRVVKTQSLACRTGTEVQQCRGALGSCICGVLGYLPKTSEAIDLEPKIPSRSRNRRIHEGERVRILALALPDQPSQLFLPMQRNMLLRPHAIYAFFRS